MAICRGRVREKKEDRMISSKRYREFATSDISRLAKTTKRYSICVCGRGFFKVFDNRQLLDRLLQWDAFMPCYVETGLSDWKVLCRQLSAGPNLTEADDEALVWLSTNAEVQDDVDMLRYYGEIFRAATVFEGSEAEVRRFLSAKLRRGL
jgi:hypothetical protein